MQIAEKIYNKIAIIKGFQKQNALVMKLCNESYSRVMRDDIEAETIYTFIDSSIIRISDSGLVDCFADETKRKQITLEQLN